MHCALASSRKTIEDVGMEILQQISSAAPCTRIKRETQTRDGENGIKFVARVNRESAWDGSLIRSPANSTTEHK